MHQHTPNLLEEFERSVDFSPVSAGTRFANYMIDKIILSILSYVVDYVTVPWHDRISNTLVIRNR